MRPYPRDSVSYRHIARAGMLVILTASVCGCATIRVTDPNRTATEEFLITQAAQRAIDQLSAVSLRDREVFVETSTLTAVPQPAQWDVYIIGEIRARLLMQGVRLVD